MAMIFNTAFEIKLRIILLLSQTKQALSMEEIVDYDFITIYSKDFGAKNEWKCIILHKNCGIVQDFA